jgi:glycosyltransferase involved in cell wall biosynthesis
MLWRSTVEWPHSLAWKLLLGNLSQWHAGATQAVAPATERGGRARSRPLRVLFVQDHLGQTMGLVHGVTRYLVSTLPAFNRAAVEPSLCVLTRRHPLGAAMLEAEGIEPIFLSRAKWDPRAVLDLVRLVRERDIDLVHVSGFKATMLGRMAARAAGRATVAHIHDARPMPPWVRAIQHRLARHTDAVIAVSQAMRRAAVEDYGVPSERVRVLYNGVLSEPFLRVPADAGRRVREELSLADDALVIGIVGRVEPGKGIVPLLKAMPAVLVQCPKAALLVVGDGPTRQTSERLAIELGVAAAVRFTGYRSDIPEMLAAMDVMAAPSTAEQGLGYSVLEAMCSGLPVVASRCGGPAECVVHGESGLLVPIADVPALAEALIDVLTDAQLRQELGHGARRRSALFSVARHVDDLQAMYRAIIAARIRQGRRSARAAELQVLATGHDGDHRPRA